jgi:endonuclease III
MKTFRAVADSDLESEQREQLRYIVQNLEATYGVPQNTRREDPLDELILTILSQSTSDINSRRAFESLKRRFPGWEQTRKARTSEIAKAIRSGGLANVKSVVIKNVLNEIKLRRGDLELGFLKTAPMKDAVDFLTTLKGVGPKTAACVLLFSCDRKVFPMDTHIFRISRRLGFLPERISDERAHERMERLIPARKHYSLHINFIRHGRAMCKPKNPKCDQCPLFEHCDFGQQVL